MGKYHLVGIKGTGMAALAISLKQLGNDITGSDVEERFFTSDSLEENLIEVKPFSKKISQMRKYTSLVLHMMKKI